MICLATLDNYVEVVNLFKNLPKDLPSEFYCELGLKRAIQDKQVLLYMDSYFNIQGALRFYFRKRDNIYSIYQRIGVIEPILFNLEPYELIK